MAIRMKKQLLSASLAAALCCFGFVGCGMRDTSERGAETTSPRRATTASTTAETTVPSTTVTTALSTDAHMTADTTGSGLLDRAESMLDDAEDIVTSVLTEATREIHNRR